MFNITSVRMFSCTVSTGCNKGQGLLILSCGLVFSGEHQRTIIMATIWGRRWPRQWSSL